MRTLTILRRLGYSLSLFSITPNKFTLPLIFLSFLGSSRLQAQKSTGDSPAQATNQSFKEAEPYGKIDIADLEMKKCDFEPDANAEVLFDVGEITVSSVRSMTRHVRIKVFNDFGKGYATIKLLYHPEFLVGAAFTKIEAETANLENGNVVLTPIEKSQIYTNKLNDYLSEIVFTLPNVKAGSIFEYRYNSYAEKTWNFQSDLPTRFSEVKMNMADIPEVRINGITAMSAQIGARMFVKQPLYEDSTNEKKNIRVFALKNVHSLPDEPFMTARRDNLQRVKFEAFGMSSPTWNRIASRFANTDIYNFKQDAVLPGQEKIIDKANEILSDKWRIAFLFDTIKNLMKWNNRTIPIPTVNLKEAWAKKTGNSAEINLILLHFLREIGLKALPTLVATKNYATIRPLDPDVYTVNNTIVTVPTDSAGRYYALDASNKYNLFDDVPLNILNTYGVRMNLDNRSATTVALEKNNPAQLLTSIDAEIKRDGKMVGTASVTGNSYHKSEFLRLLEKFDQKAYLDSAFQIGNNISVNSFKVSNKTDNKESLLQEISFTADLTSASDNYISFNTNLFLPIGENPFKNEQRFSDIDLLYGSDYGMNGIFKVPEGYKIDALPKSITIIMPDKSMMFKRTVAQDSNTILVRFVIIHRRSIYASDEYQEVRGFYKQMYDLLNEQIILKKE